MSPSAKLVSLATAVPPNVLSQSDVAAAANQCFGGRYDEFERLARVFKSSAIRRRHAVRPIDWYLTPLGWPERATAYLEGACELFVDAARQLGARSAMSGYPAAGPAACHPDSRLHWHSYVAASEAALSPRQGHPPFDRGASTHTRAARLLLGRRANTTIGPGSALAGAPRDARACWNRGPERRSSRLPQGYARGSCGDVGRRDARADASRISREPRRHNRAIRVPQGLSLLEASLRNGVPQAHVCGGRGRCSTCRIRIPSD